MKVSATPGAEGAADNRVGLSAPFPLAELPSSVIEQAMQSLRPYIVGFCRIEEGPRERRPVLLGSGTLVQIGDRRAILTAHHVVSVLPKFGRICILLEPDQAELTVDASGLAPMLIARGLVDAEGPDLGAVVLSDAIAGSIAAKKTFYNLDKHRERLLTSPPVRNLGFWFVNGFPESETVRVRDKDGSGDVMRFFNMSGAGGPDEPVTIGKHDYYRYPVGPESRDSVPPSFGGMSGGGLWQIPVRKLPSGELVPMEPLFSGVIYYQINTPSEYALLCHGRKSVYEVAYDALRTASPPR